MTVTFFHETLYIFKCPSFITSILNTILIDLFFEIAVVHNAFSHRQRTIIIFSPSTHLMAVLSAPPSHLLLHQGRKKGGLAWAGWAWLVRVRRYWRAEVKIQIAKGE